MGNDMKCFIYGLVVKGTNDIRYVGQTLDPETRLFAHIKDALDPYAGTTKAAWVSDALSSGLEIDMVILEECGLSNRNSRERYWYDYGINDGWRLTNDVSPSGVDGKIKKPGTCNKLSISVNDYVLDAIYHAQQISPELDSLSSAVASIVGQWYMAKTEDGRFDELMKDIYGKKHMLEAAKAAGCDCAAEFDEEGMEL